MGDLRVYRLMGGLAALFMQGPAALAQDSTQCGGMSLVFEGNCGAESRFVRVCLGDGRESAFTLKTGESHRLWVSQGSKYNAYCGVEALPCPGAFDIALESCSAEPSQPSAPSTGKAGPKTKG